MRSFKKGLKFLFPSKNATNPLPTQNKIISSSNKQQSTNTAPNITATKDKYRSHHKTGPQLLITKILMYHGPLKSKQIWRSYQRILNDQRQANKTEENLQYFNSLTKLKQTIKFMRLNKKIASNGYERKIKQFKGWKLNQARALKHVHPDVIQDIQDKIKKRDQF